MMEEKVRLWTARGKSALILDIIQGKTAVTAASRQFDLPFAGIENWIENGKRGMENALRAKPEDVRGQYDRQLKDLQMQIRAGSGRAPALLRDPSARCKGDLLAGSPSITNDALIRL